MSWPAHRSPAVVLALHTSHVTRDTSHTHTHTHTHRDVTLAHVNTSTHVTHVTNAHTHVTHVTRRPQQVSDSIPVTALSAIFLLSCVYPTVPAVTHTHKHHTRRTRHKHTHVIRHTRPRQGSIPETARPIFIWLLLFCRRHGRTHATHAHGKAPSRCKWLLTAPLLGLQGPTAACVGIARAYLRPLYFLGCNATSSSLPLFSRPTSPIFPSLLQREWEAGLEGTVSASYLNNTKGAQAH
jgi:hypothetical protein